MCLSDSNCMMKRTNFYVPPTLGTKFRSGGGSERPAQSGWPFSPATPLEEEGGKTSAYAYAYEYSYTYDATLLQDPDIQIMK